MPAVMSCSLAHAVGSRSGQDAVKGGCALSRFGRQLCMKLPCMLQIYGDLLQ